jgi:hypothetical protein
MTPVPPLLSAAAPLDDVSLRVRVYRYFFYGWLFRDADAGTALERSAALRHNCRQSRWLPLYLFRWAVLGLVLMAFEQLSEHVSGNSPMSAALGLCLIFVVLFQLVTAISWAFLRAGRQAR